MHILKELRSNVSYLLLLHKRLNIVIYFLNTNFPENLLQNKLNDKNDKN